MAGALIRGLLASGNYPATDICVAEKLAAQRRRVVRSFRVRATPANLEVAANSDIVILAVKPQIMHEVLAEIRPAVRPSTLVVSIAAGVRLRRIEDALGSKARVVRVMPNTPALVGRGMSVIARGRHASARDEARTLDIFRAVGDAVAVPREAMLDAVTGLSGSGPAFVYLLTEGLIAGGRAAGLPQKLAERLAYQTIAGAVAMMQETGRTPADLRDMVSSPGGTTLAGLAHLQSQGFRQAAMGAVAAATARSRELGV
jgi:pyrroline-5-carboxylate reductase